MQHATCNILMKPHHPNTKLYLMVFGALLVLTVVTVTVSYLHFPPALGIAIGLAIATVKASLVASFFMHLKGERALIYGLLCLTIIFVTALFVLPISDTAANSNLRIVSQAAVEHHEP